MGSPLTRRTSTSTIPTLPTLPTVGRIGGQTVPPTPLGFDAQAVNGTSVTVTLPAGLLTDDLAVLVWNGKPTPTGADPFYVEIGPVGWTFVDSAVRSGSMESYVWTKRLTPADSSTTITVTVPTSQKLSLGLAVYRDAKDFRVTKTVYSNSSTTHAAPQITTSVPTQICSFYCERGSAPSTSFTAQPGALAGSGFNIGGGATAIGVSSITATQTPGIITPGDWVTNTAQSGVIIWTLACAGLPMDPPKVKVQNIVYPVVAAHRFGSQEGPQNTLFTADLVLPHSPISIGECDIRQNADGTLVVWHDTTVDAQAGGGKTGLVSTYTDAQWQTLKVVWPWGTNPDEPASFWSEILTKWGGRRVLMPEAKEDGVVDPLATSITAAGLTDSMIVQSADYLRAKALVAKGLHVLYLCTALETNFSTYAADGITHVGYERSNVTAQICSDAHAAGLKVWAYSVNNDLWRDDLLGYGVDGLFSNKPSTIIIP